MFKKIFITATWKQSQITIIGTVINGILGTLFYIFMARFLGPANFGLLTVSIATLTLIADTVDFGTNTGIVRFVSSHLSSDKDKALKFLKLGLKIKFIVWITVFMLGFYLSPLIANLVFNKSELQTPLRLVMVGVGGALFFTFATAALQSFQKFFLWSFVNVASNLLRLVIIFILFFTQQLNLFNGLITYIALPFLGFTLALFFLPIREILDTSNEISIAKDFFKFNRWVALFTIIAAISSRLDIFLTTRLLSTKDLGIYGVASQLTQVVPQIVGALGVVAAPKFASFQNIHQMLVYFKKFQMLTLGLSFAGLLIIPGAFYFIPLAFGVNYIPAILPFCILFISMLIFLISIPVHSSIIFYFGRPDIFVWVSLIHLLIISLAGFYLITNFGVIGTASTVLIGMLSNFFIPLFYFLYKIRK